jgi:hypothetical protein
MTVAICNASGRRHDHGLPGLDGAGAGREVMGFTDHDRDLDRRRGLPRRHRPDGQRLPAGHRLAVDNSEAVGALSDAADHRGRSDRRALRWRRGAGLAGRTGRTPPGGHQIFRGTLGEVTRRSGQFRAELRGPVGCAEPAAGAGLYAQLLGGAGGSALPVRHDAAGLFQYERTVETVDDFAGRFCALPTSRGSMTAGSSSVGWKC